MMAAERREQQQQESRRAIVLSCSVLQLQMAPQQLFWDFLSLHVLLGSDRGPSLLASLCHSPLLSLQVCWVVWALLASRSLHVTTTQGTHRAGAQLFHPPIALCFKTFEQFTRKSHGCSIFFLAWIDKTTCPRKIETG